MTDVTVKKLEAYLRQIEKLATTGDCEAIAREARLALRLCEGQRR